jgi:hypothetical protein
MDYLDGSITKEEFITSRGTENTQRSCKSSLKMLDVTVKKALRPTVRNEQKKGLF